MQRRSTFTAKKRTGRKSKNKRKKTEREREKCEPGLVERINKNKMLQVKNSKLVVLNLTVSHHIVLELHRGSFTCPPPYFLTQSSLTESILYVLFMSHKFHKFIFVHGFTPSSSLKISQAESNCMSAINSDIPLKKIIKNNGSSQVDSW